MSQTRYFTVEEANALLPVLIPALTLAVQLRGQLQVAYEALCRAGEPPTPATVERLEGPPALVAARGRFRALAETLAEQVQTVQRLDVSIKDLDIGLCDFLGRYEDRDVWLCWRLGETAVEHWHELDAGFAGRQPISMPSPRPLSG